MINIWEMYDKSVELVRSGESVPRAIFRATRYETNYEHDTTAMLTFWHEHQVAPFANRWSGYPRASADELQSPHRAAKE